MTTATTKRTSRKEHAARMQALRAQARAIVATGVCPDCGFPLKANLSITGWYQCVAYACDAFREPQYRDLPKCHFQCFTD